MDFWSLKLDQFCDEAASKMGEIILFQSFTVYFDKFFFRFQI